MRVGFRNADLEALAELWNEVAPSVYSLHAARFKTHLIGSDLFDWGASAIALDNGKPAAFVAIKRSAASLYAGPDRDTAHVSAFACTECELGVDLLADAKEVLAARGVYRLTFGQDSLHFFPGCPDNWPKLHDFLLVEGFTEGSECVDLIHDLAEYAPPCSLAEEVRPIETATVPLLLDFLAREFPNRWLNDTQMKLEKESHPGFVYGLFLHGRCEGFAVTQDGSHSLPIGGAVFNESLGANWCALGPIGVSKPIRGLGWGDKLLATSLNSMKAAGKRNCRIDWTSLIDWYGRHGFKPERRYRNMVLRLDETAFL